MPFRILIACVLLAQPSLHAESRSWKSADGERSVQGEFISRDDAGITILRSADRKQVVIPLHQLHPDDRTWITVHHPLPGTETAPASAVFDQLVFGDNRQQVLAKLLASKFVESTVEETFFGRTGLNGVFRTRGKIGGLDAMLYFDWTEQGALKEITLHTAALPAADLATRLVPCWKEFIGLLTTLHGTPANANNHLDITTIENGGMACTHLWKLENSGSALLGGAREGDAYQIAVRFTTEDIKPVILPAKTTSARQTP